MIVLPCNRPRHCCTLCDLLQLRAYQCLIVLAVVLGQVLKVLEGHTDNVKAVAISVDGSKIVSGSWDKTVRVWSMATGEVIACCVKSAAT